MRFSIALLSTAAALQATSPYPRGVYDPSSAASYYRTRPLEVLGRGASLVSQSAGFGLSLLGDFVAGDLDKRADERAAELVELAQEQRGDGREAHRRGERGEHERA